MQQKHLTTGSIFDFTDGAIVITTNGIIRKNGRAVMGAGIAKATRDRYTDIDLKLGKYLSKYGNRAFYMGKYDDQIVLTFPTKHDWKDKSDIELIKTSAEQIVAICDKWHIEKVYLPRPGCSNGGLKWEDVKSVIEPILDDRFIVITQDVF